LAEGDVSTGAAGLAETENERLVLQPPQPNELPACTHQVYVSDAKSNVGANVQTEPEHAEFVTVCVNAPVLEPDTYMK